VQAEVSHDGSWKNLQKFFADAHPVDNVVEPCLDWLKANEAVMQQTANDSEVLSRRIRFTMVLLGILGPASGLIGGYGVARGLSRSIYQLSVSLQGAAQRLDQEIASVSIEGDGDLRSLDRQIQHVVSRVEEVAERVQRQERDMLRAEQLSAVGQLAAGVAHEVRNPLTSVKLLVESALTARQRKPLTEEDLRVIHTEIVRLEQTVQSFLDFARPPAPKRSCCDLRDLITQAIELSRARARLQGVTIDIAVPAEPVVTNVDAGQIRTVLVNLCINALDAMPQGGRLEVSLEQAAGGDACVHVNDTGGGIAPEILERLFTPFSSSKATGTGLGLSISRRIIEEHGGQITVDNGEQGARFTIRLPAPVPEESHAETVSGR
jgi:signal transduction histidine kinase